MADKRWLFDTTHSVIWHDLEDGSLLFHRLTGETHFFNLYATFVLRSLMEAPMSADALTKYLAGQLDQTLDDDLSRQVADMLTNFEEMGLIDEVAA